jgi:hypothetical protein
MSKITTLLTKRFFVKNLLLVVSILFVNFVSGQSLSSDQDDYSPGSTATFTGSGFQANEEVTVQVLHYDGTSDGGADHQPWTVVADASGSFVTTWHVCEDDCVGSTLKATADGQSGLHAEIIFTDGPLDNFRTVTSGNWNSLSTWEYQPGGVGPYVPVPAIVGTPTATTAATITIQNTHTVTVTAAVSADQVVVASGGQVNVNSGIILTIANGAGTDLTINGTVSVSGTLTEGSATDVAVNGNLNITSTGTMNGNGGNGATRPHFVVNNGGNWTIDAGGSWSTAGSGPAEIAIAVGGSATLNGSVTGMDVFTMNGTATSSAAITMSGGTLTVGGTFTKTGIALGGMVNLFVNGTLTSSVDINAFVGSVISDLEVNGVLTMTAGTLTISRGNGGTMGSINSGGTLNLQGSSIFNLNGVGTSTYSVASGGTLAIAPLAIVNGSSQLIVNGGANLKIGSSNGIVDGTTTIGNVRTSVADTYSTSANYSYTGATQNTGTALPSTVNNLTISSSGVVTLNNAAITETVSGLLSVTSGTFNQGASANVIATGGISVSSGATYQDLGTGDITLGAGVANAGTIVLDGSCGGNDDILIRSSVVGVQRPWSGAGTFNISDVNVQDQAGTASITALSSTNSGNNGANWTFVAGCVACTPTYNSETQTACESYTWHGTTYTTSGNYVYSYTNAGGCASADTLHLTVNYGTHNSESQTA